MFTDFQIIITRMLTASFLGGIIGFERELHGRNAGLRTHLLVSLGASVYTMLSIIFGQNGTLILDLNDANFDPGRIAAQIVSGIGFIGAGVILKEGFSIKGLTTAACLWFVASAGMATGAGFYTIGFLSTMIGLISLLLLSFVEKNYSKYTNKTLIIKTTLDKNPLDLIPHIRKKGTKIIHVIFSKNYNQQEATLKLSLRLFHKGTSEDILKDLLDTIEIHDAFIKEIKWDNKP